MSDDPVVESYLRQFRPRPPRPLPVSSGRPPWRGLLAAAAAVVLAVAAVVGNQMRTVTPVPTVAQEAPRALRLIRTDFDRMDLLLDAEASRCLPDVETPGRALAVVAQWRKNL